MFFTNKILEHFLIISAGTSGSPYSSDVQFPAGTPASSRIPIRSSRIDDDNIGLEEDEVYQLMFSSASRSDNVILGQPTTITIIDEDGNKFEIINQTMLSVIC